MFVLTFLARCFNLRLFVSQQDYAKTTKLISMKFGGRVEDNPRNNWISINGTSRILTCRDGLYSLLNLPSTVLKILLSRTESL